MVKLVALVVAIIGGVALWLASPGSTASRAAASGAATRAAPAVPRAAPGSTTVDSLAGLASCEAGLVRDRTPSMVVVGASFTAGVGSGGPYRSWAAILARMMQKNAVVYGMAGAGYVRSGAGRRGPVAAEIARLELARLAPSLVIVQAGHDDIGVAPGFERQRVTQAIKLIRAEAPRAVIALVTVFRGHASLRAARRTDSAIVAAATTADPRVIIMDPLAGHWQYQRASDGLHPTATGSEWLAAKAAAILKTDGVLGPAVGSGVSLDHAGARASVLCDYGVNHSPGHTTGLRGFPRVDRLGRGQAESHQRAAAGRGLGRDGAAMTLGDLPDDGQP